MRARRWVLLLIVITLIQIAIGTQVRGGVDQALDAGVARDAALATVGTLDYLHRDAAFVVLIGAVLLTFWLVSRNNPPKGGHHIAGGHNKTLVGWAWIGLGLAALQVVLGVVMAYVTLLPAAQVLHLTVASLLLGAQTVLWLLAGPGRTPAA